MGVRRRCGSRDRSRGRGLDLAEAAPSLLLGPDTADAHASRERKLIAYRAYVVYINVYRISDGRVAGSG